MEDIEVTGNSIANQSPSGFGILANYLSNLKVSENTVRRTTGAFWCYNSSKVFVANNLFDISQQQAVYLGTCQGITLRGNRFNNYNMANAGYAGLAALDLQSSTIAQNEFNTMRDVTAISVFGAAANEVRLTRNSLLYPSQAPSFSNTGTNPNQGQITPLGGTNTTMVNNTLVNATSRVLVTQTSGAPLQFSVGAIAGGFQLISSTNAVGNETFSYEIQ